MCLATLTPRALLLALLSAACAVFFFAPVRAGAYEARVPEGFFGTSDPVLFDLARDNSPRLNAEAESIAAGGLGFARITLDWQAIEPNAPVGGLHRYSWSTSDRLVAALARNGLSMVPSLWSTPWWARSASDASAGCRQNSALDPAYTSDYGAFAKAVAARYGHDGSFWSAHPELSYEPLERVEIWNEPNWGPFYCLHPDPAAFADLAVSAGSGIRAADPSIETALGGLVLIKGTQYYSDGSIRAMPPGQFLRKAVAARPDLAGLIDSIGIHPYDMDPDANISLLGWMRRQLAGGPLADKSFLVTEFGWHTSGAGENATEEERAEKFAALTGRLARTDCDITGIAVHAWTTAEADPANADDWYGIADPADESLYPSGQAYVDAVKTYRGTGSAPAPRRTIRVCGGPDPDQDFDGAPDAEDDYPLDPSRFSGSGEIPSDDRATPTPVTPRVPSDYFAVANSYMPAREGVRTAHYDQMQTLGIGQVRETIDWHNIERAALAAEPDERFDWSDLDRRQVAYANRGIGLGFNEIGAPGWLAAEPSSADARFAEFLAALATRYGTGGSFWAENQNLDPTLAVRDYEVWTDPNGSNANWLGTRFTAAQYADTYAAAREALHAADAKARAIVSLGDAGDGTMASTFLRGMASARPSLAGSIDGVYVSLTQTRTEGGVEDAVAKVREALAATGNPSARLYVGFGAPTAGAGSMSEADRAAFVRETAEALPRLDCMVDRAVLYSWTSPQGSSSSSYDWFGVTDPLTGETTSTATAYGDASVSWGGFTDPPADLSALHPCGTDAPDRDGDGVADADDPEPLDPSVPQDPADPDPPAGPLQVEFLATPDRPTRRTTARFRFQAEGAVAFECKLDAHAYADCASGIVLRGLRNGPHRFAVRAVGSDGSLGEPSSYRWLVDTKAPKFRFRGRAKPRSEGRVRVSFKTKDATGVKKLRCRVDGRAWRRCHSPWKTPRLGAGRHRLQIKAVDRVGNTAKVTRKVRIKRH